MTLSSGAFNLAQIAADVVSLRFQSSCTSVTSAENRCERSRGFRAMVRAIFRTEISTPC